MSRERQRPRRGYDMYYSSSVYKGLGCTLDVDTSLQTVIPERGNV